MKANRALILAPTSSSAKKLFYNGNFAGKIDTAGKLFIKKLFVKWALSPRSGENCFGTLHNL